MIRFASAGIANPVSRAAFAAALALGAAGAMTALPGVAMAKSEAPKLQLSKGFLAAAQPAQAAVNAAKDDASIAAARPLVDAAFAAATNNDDKMVAGQLAYSLGSKAKDQALQRKGVQAMVDSGKATPEQAGQLALAAGQLAYLAKDYPDAIKYLKPLVDAGGADPNAAAMLGESYMAAGQTDLGLATFQNAIVASRKAGTLAPESWYRRAIGSAYKAHSLQGAATFGSMLIADYPTPANVGLAVTVVRDLGNFGSQDELDLVRLMGRTNSYAEGRDYVEYIQAADPRRLPGETLDVINAGLSSGKLQASDTFVSDAKTQATSRLAADKASLEGYAADARKPAATEATVSGAADALLSYGRNAEAETLYASSLTKPGVDANRALTRMGIAQMGEGKFAEAQATFDKVTGTRKPIAMLWSAYAASKAHPAPAAAPAAAPAN